MIYICHVKYKFICISDIRKEQRGALMNISKFTQKSMQAVEGCEKLAYEYDCSYISSID